MFRKFFYFIFGVLLIILFSCSATQHKSTVFFGGKIKNPKGKSIFIFKGDVEIAKTNLDFENEFEFKLDSLSAGLYTFKHGKEFQYFFLNPNDSLLVRLNTWDFDESLVFTGKGAERNNFLLQLFLENERQEKVFNTLFSLNEAEFIKKADSLLQLKTILAKQFQSATKKQPNLFNELIESAIYLPVYSNKEKYASKYKHKNNLEKLPNLSTSFYAFRDSKIIKNTKFPNYYLYENYLWFKVYNKALIKEEMNNKYELSTLLLKEITENVQNKTIQNNMLEEVYVSSLLNVACDKNDKMIAKQLFFDNCTDERCKKDVKKLLSVLKTLSKDTYLPNLSFKNSDGKSYKTKELIKKKTVLYFWPKDFNRIENMSKRVRYLARKYPNFNFIGVDAQLDNNLWKNYVNKTGLNKSMQFQINDNVQDVYFTDEIPRALIIDEYGKIKSNYTYLTQGNFESRLALLEKSK